VQPKKFNSWRDNIQPRSLYNFVHYTIPCSLARFRCHPRLQPKPGKNARNRISLDKDHFRRKSKSGRLCNRGPATFSVYKPSASMAFPSMPSPHSAFLMIRLYLPNCRSHDQSLTGRYDPIYPYMISTNYVGTAIKLDRHNQISLRQIGGVRSSVPVQMTCL
jgi:hypothetical protein